MFGTLYIPSRYEQFEIGLGQAGNPHDTVWRAYAVPVVEAYRELRVVGRDLWRKIAMHRGSR